MRLFVAIDPGSPARDRIESALVELRREVPDVRWGRSDAIHLTLKFLGEVAESRRAAIADAVDRAAARAGDPFAVELKGVGAFGDRRRPRVVWLGLTDPAGRLAAAAAAVESVFEEEGFAREKHSFNPHLTLARPKALSKSLPAAVAARSELNLGSIEVRSVILFQSVLHSSGADYTRLHEAGLGSGGEAARARNAGRR